LAFAYKFGRYEDTFIYFVGLPGLILGAAAYYNRDKNDEEYPTDALLNDEPSTN
jgi:hypothetical protein